MSLNLELVCEDREATFRIGAELPAVAERGQELGAELELLCGVDGLGEPDNVSRAALLSAVRQTEQYLREHPEKLGMTYMYRREQFLSGPEREVVRTPDSKPCTGGCGGIQLQGDDEHFYFLWCDLNECRLDKMAVREDGMGEIVEKSDIRGVEELQTTTHGRIEITTKKAGTGVLRTLRKIREFLEECDGDIVTKTIG